VVAAEIGQAGIHAHAGTGGDDEDLGFSDDPGGFSEHGAPPELFLTLVYRCCPAIVVKSLAAFKVIHWGGGKVQ
jgi:hypothetical protein